MKICPRVCFNDQIHHCIIEDTEGGFSGRCLELPGAISQGETLEELKVNITDAIQLMLASIYEEAHEKKKMEIEVSV